MALSDRDYVARRKKNKGRRGAGGRRGGGARQTWMGVNRNFVLGALIVIALCIAAYAFQYLQARGR